MPGGGLSPDATRWISCRPGFFLPVRVLSRLFRRRFLEQLEAAFTAGTLHVAGSRHALRDPHAWARYLAPLRHVEWVVYATRPFAGPQHVLDYVGRYTHRVAMGNDRIRDIDREEVHFTDKDYRADPTHAIKTMTLAATECMRRFLLHVLPLGFRRIRDDGFLGPRHRAEKLTRCRQLLDATARRAVLVDTVNPGGDPVRLDGRAPLSTRRCPACGQGQLIVIDRLPPTRRLPIGADTS